MRSGRKYSNSRQYHGFDRRAEFRSATACGHWRVDDVVVFAALGTRARAGIERHLMRRAVHDARIRPEDFLRAVTVMNVEVDDRDTFCPVMLLRVTRGDRGVVEKTKPHRRRGFGVMARRTHCNECVVRVSVHHFVDGEHRAADGTKNRFPASAMTGPCPRRCGPTPASAPPPAWPRRKPSGWTRVMASNSPSGAGSRARSANCSSSRTALIARRRSGRSGWPAGVACWRPESWLSKRVVIIPVRHAGYARPRRLTNRG